MFPVLLPAFAQAGCAEADFFQFDNDSLAWNELSAHPDSGDEARVYVSSRAAGCGGVAEVTWEPGSEALATWSPVDLDTGMSDSVVWNVDLPLALYALTSHPHVADTWYLGGVSSPVCDACEPGGVFTLQRRRTWVYNPFTTAAGWVDDWAVDRLGDDTLQHRAVVDIDLGPGEGDRWDSVAAIYLATAGGGWWPGVFVW